jgi:hypothetical protein
VTKCNENQSKEETKNKAPKIINTDKYMITHLPGLAQALQ